jgi:enediyne polyketide synthase
VAREPGEFGQKLDRAIAAVESGREEIDADDGLCVARRSSSPRIGFLFPGQAAPSRPHGGLWARRFDWMRDVVASVPCLPDQGGTDTAIAQPAIAAASLAAWRLLAACGVEASVAVGHSLGELAALAWAGAIAPADLVRLAATRGALMAGEGRADGGMLRIAAGCRQVRTLIESLDLCLACTNGPKETVVSGPRAALMVADERARRAGLETTQLSVSHAFHSAMMGPAVAPFAMALAEFRIGPAGRAIASTVTGKLIEPADDVLAMLVRQLVAPVQFEAALRVAAEAVDLLIEVGPGAGLTRLARQTGCSAVSVDAFSDSLFPLLSALGTAHAFGATLTLAPLFQDRPIRPLDRAVPRFLTSPCGRPGAIAAGAPVVALDSGTSPTEEVEAPDAAIVDVLTLMRDVIAEETGFAAADIGADDRFLDDLHLNSLAVSRIAAKSARLLGCSIPVMPTEFAKATPRALADALATMNQLGPHERREPERIPGVRLWVRPFEVRWVSRERTDQAKRPSYWKVLPVKASDQDRSAIDIISNRDGRPDGVLVWIGQDFDASATHELFSACRNVWAAGEITRLAICHAGAPVSAFARSLALEERFDSIVVIERPRRGNATQRILEELDAADSDFLEVRIEEDGSRGLPEFAAARPVCDRRAAITQEDVVLVTGGAKGIGAECALRIGARTGAALILAGRSPGDDPAVKATLARAAALNIRCRYAAADVCDAAALSQAVAAAAEDIGAVTALIHAAGMNDPTLFQQISDADLQQVLTPKTLGLRAAIAAAGPRLRRIVTFGSILGRMGLKGEAHYAIANAWQSLIAEQYAREDCRVLSVEWSLWNGVGMGHRLGSLERLARFGVDALPVDAALEVFESLLLSGAVGTYMVTSRFGPPRQVSLGATELPILRFVDKPLLHYPGVELVVETELSCGRDLYSPDHRIDGTMIFPAVLGLETMAQVASALAGGGIPVAIESVAFPQAVVVPDDGAARIQIMALANEGGRIEVAIRADDDAFAADRMRATVVFDSPSANGACLPNAAQAAAIRSMPSVDAKPLYGSLFFQGERFRRVRSFSHLSARRIAATLSARGAAAWFSPFEPQQLVLGNPAVRDALLHALQAAVPHRRVIPVSVDRISLHSRTQAVRMEAVEREATEDRFVFDIVARDTTGAVVESWQAVEFRAISYVDDVGKLLASTPALAAAYVERVARAALGDDSIEVALIVNSQLAREERRRRAITALGLDDRVFARSDGKPVLIGCDQQLSLSIAHRDGVTLAVKAAGNIGCDIEAVADWSGATSPSPLSASDQALAVELAADVEPLPVAAARLWGVYETTLKQARRVEPCCKAHRRERDGVVLFETASGRTATMRVPGPGGDFVIAVGLCTTDTLLPTIGAAASEERVGVP